MNSYIFVQSDVDLLHISLYTDELSKESIYSKGYTIKRI